MYVWGGGGRSPGSRTTSFERKLHTHGGACHRRDDLDSMACVSQICGVFPEMTRMSFSDYSSPCTRFRSTDFFGSERTRWRGPWTRGSAPCFLLSSGRGLGAHLLHSNLSCAYLALGLIPKACPSAAAPWSPPPGLGSLPLPCHAVPPWFRGRAAGAPPEHRAARGPGLVLPKGGPIARRWAIPIGLAAQRIIALPDACVGQ